MSEGDERRGAGDEGSVTEMAASLLGGERDRFGDTDADGDEIISETSTLLPPTTTTQPSPPLAAQNPPQPATSRNTERDYTDEEGQAAAETHIDPRTWRRRETALSLLLLAGMMTMVLLAVVRAMRGGFSPGLLVGGGLMVVLCAVVDRREVRGRVMRG